MTQKIFIDVIQNTKRHFSNPYLLEDYVKGSRYSKLTNIEKRLTTWLTFFNEHHYLQHHSNYELTIEAILDISSNSSLFLDLTYYEVSIAQELYLSIFKLKNPLLVKNKRAAMKLFVLVLIYGKYPGMFRGSIIKELDKVTDEIDEGIIMDITSVTLVKYAMPKFLILEIHLLNTEELDILMRGLRGENAFRHEYFNHQITKREFSELMSLDLHKSCFDLHRYCFDDHLLIRSLIYIKILGGNFHNDNALRFLECNLTFQENPYKYLSEISFWKKAYDLICPSSVNAVGLDLESCVAYLESLLRENNKLTCLKGRTTQSISRLIHCWFSEDYNHDWLKLDWPSKGKKSVVFFYEGFEYKVEELISGEQLFNEGLKMSHCVFTCALECYYGNCSIWSIKKKTKGKFKEYLTMKELNNSFIEEKARFNQMPTDHEYNLIDYCAQLLGFEVLEDSPTRYGGYVMYHCPN